MQFSVTPHKVCPTKISFELEGNVVHNVVFTNGCSGNLKAISRLIEGMTVEQVEGYLKGNTCGAKDTSCGDQLARALRAKYEESRLA